MQAKNLLAILTTTIFGNVWISVGVDQYFDAFRRTIHQFLDVAA